MIVSPRTETYDVFPVEKQVERSDNRKYVCVRRLRHSIQPDGSILLVNIIERKATGHPFNLTPKERKLSESCTLHSNTFCDPE